MTENMQTIYCASLESSFVTWNPIYVWSR